MKIAVLHNCEQGAPYITLRPDNAVLRNNDDFYIPHFSSNIVAQCGVILRITRLAKCIAPKFASRCYDSLTAGISFIAKDVMEQAISCSRPCDEAYSFDRSTAVGTEWIEPQSIGNGDVTMHINDNQVLKLSLAELPYTIDDCISIVSQKLTLKTGDLVFIAFPETFSVSEGTALSVTINDVQPLNFQVK